MSAGHIQIEYRVADLSPEAAYVDREHEQLIVLAVLWSHPYSARRRSEAHALSVVLRA